MMRTRLLTMRTRRPTMRGGFLFVSICVLVTSRGLFVKRKRRYVIRRRGLVSSKRLPTREGL
jgi:hypothetical protein